ncbi:hypothetical protein Agub_g3772 [Astrephomene gubernaculifera]|uniref:Uncharacterized protein n=1 Tax=Astrephomene gubernaculifera TaxID=47775 RepID=A0AAD3DN36_9CHLO|nr:hypothetical protein Agub_g3772 [Astrephomene gubernaculifera]
MGGRHPLTSPASVIGPSMSKASKMRHGPAMCAGLDALRTAFLIAALLAMPFAYAADPLASGTPSSTSANIFGSVDPRSPLSLLQKTSNTLRNQAHRRSLGSAADTKASTPSTSDSLYGTAATCGDLPFELQVAGLVEDRASTRSHRYYPTMLFHLILKDGAATDVTGAASVAGLPTTVTDTTTAVEAMTWRLSELQIELNGNVDYLSWQKPSSSGEVKVETEVNGISVTSSIVVPSSFPYASSSTNTTTLGGPYLSVSLGAVRVSQPLRTTAGGDIIVATISVKVTSTATDGPVLSLSDYVITSTEFFMEYSTDDASGDSDASSSSTDPANIVSVYFAYIQYSLTINTDGPEKQQSGSTAEGASPSLPYSPVCRASLYLSRLGKCASCGGGDYYSVCYRNIVQTDCYLACYMCGFRPAPTYVTPFGLKNPRGCIPCTTHPSGWCSLTPMSPYVYCCAI